MSMRKAAALTGLLALTLGTAACAVEEGGQGSGDGPITIACGAMEDWCQKMTTEFTAKTGIDASFVRLSSGETVARLEAAKASPEFDVWHGGPVDGFGAAKNADLIEAYASPARDAIPDKYKDSEGYWTGVYVGVLGFCSNQKVLDKLGLEAPTSWEALLDPKLSKNVSSAHPSTSGTAFTTLWTQVTRLGGDDEGLGYMAKLHNNILQYSKSGTAPGQTAGRGEVAVGLVFSHDCVKYKEEGMTDLVVSFPEEGTGYEIGGVALVKGSKHAEAAKKYIDWALTAEAQDNGPTVGSFQVLTHPDAKVDERMVRLDDVNLVDYDFVAAAAAKKGLTARFDEEIASQPKE